MKLTGILLLAIIVLGCNTTSPEEKAKQKADSIKLHNALLPDAEKRQICKDRVRDPSEFDYTKHLTFNSFFKQYYPYDSLALKNYGDGITQELYNLQEELINPNYIVKKEKWFRLYVCRTFYNSFILRVEKDNGVYLLTYKLSRMSGYESVGTLFQYSGNASDNTMLVSLFSMLDKFSFSHNYSNPKQCAVQHGTLYQFEYYDGKRYRIAGYANPERDGVCGSKDAYSLAIHCINIIKKSPAFGFIKNNFGMEDESPYRHLQMYPETLAKE